MGLMITGIGFGFLPPCYGQRWALTAVKGIRTVRTPDATRMAFVGLAGYMTSAPA